MVYDKDIRKTLLETKKMPIIYSIQDLADELLISSNILKKIDKHSYTYYKEFEIDKNGNQNSKRKIRAPKYTLKVIQAWILRNILEKETLHKSAMAYRKGKEFGIKNNAISHKEKEYIMKIDFKDFFPSIKRENIFFMFNNFGYSRELSNIFANICTYKGELPQGAVTSPYISNILLKTFDKKINKYCINNDVIYSRYADDIVISSNRKSPLYKAREFLINLVESYEGGHINLTINEEKSFNIYGKNTKKVITGLLVNNEDIRVTRKYKRKIRSKIFNELKKKNNNVSQEIYGSLGFIKEVDTKSFIQLTNYIKKLNLESKFKMEFLNID
jgi:retron-type reverse transcriptase